MSQIYWPFSQSTITEGYGWADWRQGIHDGIDFGVPQGTELRATMSGTIYNNDAGAAGGAGVDITAPDGMKARHWHVSKFLLPNGTNVQAGDVIALSGGTPGTWGAGFSTGAHLHWGIMVNKVWVDPAQLGPQDFSNIKPVKEKSKTIMGAFYRVSDGDHLGWIYWQEKPNTAFTWIDGPTWAAYSGNGNMYGAVTQAEIEVLINKYGEKK